MKFHGKLGTHAGAIYHTNKRKLPKPGDRMQIKEVTARSNAWRFSRWRSVIVDKVELFGDTPFIFMSYL